MDRFRSLDTYRIEREWKRYDGTPQRELFRRIRERFLHRHAVPAGRTLDLGSGPGRFTPWIGGPATLRVAADLSTEALGHLRTHWPDGTPLPDRVLGDGRRLPFRSASFTEVALLGNPLGFAGADAERIVSSVADVVQEDGLVLVETAPGPPTASQYLRRLPPTALVRLLRAPVAAVRRRVEREPFLTAPAPDRTRHGFRPLGEDEVGQMLSRLRLEPIDALAVAPALGNDRARLAAIHEDPRAWEHLVELEESLGRSPERRRSAAALLIAARAVPRGKGEIK